MSHKPHNFTRHKSEKAVKLLNGKPNGESVLYHKHLTIPKYANLLIYLIETVEGRNLNKSTGS